MSTMMSSAQVLDKVIVVNNSYEVMTEHTFVDGDSLKFSVICDDVVNHNFEWEACIEIQDNSFMSLIKRHVTSNSFGFSVSPSLFTQSNIKRIEFQNDSCIYYHTKVFLYEDAVVLDSLSLHINVLPSKPKFVRLSLDGIFDYEDCCYRQQIQPARQRLPVGRAGWQGNPADQQRQPAAVAHHATWCCLARRTVPEQQTVG